ncbi:carbohydrate ABC transporter membrane protein 1, CUT1 family [Arthrobacter sp. ok909]|uniref:carbohydrate ABC transporter permease n=1 Tax=Arthrobacter sp. ok909 TaxID=1761746 RepID=UPI0008867BF4|nr:sugar ABC transporter permease [Arthrobacter sp. ok909]SDP66399.1 carbohydrate ABC transporter membrane protein 1, CUT1 family [Arthrobacter sp. ok909]
MALTTAQTGLSRARRGVAPGGPGKPVNRKSKLSSQTRKTFFWLLLPSVVLLILIHGYPLIYASIQATHNGSLLDTGEFVGLDNFATVLSSEAFWKAARFTLIFTIVGVFGSWLLGLGLALLLRTKIPAGGTFKVLLLLPWVVPIVVSSTAWNWLVGTPDSLIPSICRNLGLGTPLFLADPTLAAITVCIFKVWVSFPFMMMMTSAALASVDTTVYEAASMDGATRFQQFSGITLPLIARSTYISWILMTIFCVNDFPTIYLLTGGGPVDATTSLVVLAYRTVFQDFQTGPGVAIAFLMTITLVVISVILYRQIRKSSVE